MTVNKKYHQKPCAFRAIVQERYASSMYRKVYKVVQNPVIASNLVNETIEDACDCFTTIPPLRDLRIFLYTRAYNKSMEYIRSEIKSSLF